MKRVTRAVLSVCFVLLAIWGAAVAYEWTHIPSQTRQLVRPVLRARFWSTDEYRPEDLIESIARQQEPAADEALVILSCYYLGEHEGEEIAEAIIIRGTRMLPLLVRYRDTRLLMDDEPYSRFFLLPAATRYQMFNAIGREIKQPEMHPATRTTTP